MKIRIRPLRNLWTIGLMISISIIWSWPASIFILLAQFDIRKKT